MQKGRPVQIRPMAPTLALPEYWRRESTKERRRRAWRRTGPNTLPLARVLSYKFCPTKKSGEKLNASPYMSVNIEDSAYA